MFRRAILVSIALTAVAVASPALASDDCVRVQQVRAFSVESENSLIVRQGPSRFHRITVASDCPLAEADRIGLVQGNSQLYVVGRGSQFIPTSGGSLSTRFCTATPHAYVSIIDDSQDRRPRCRIQAIEPTTAEQFEAANNTRDNRY